MLAETNQLAEAEPLIRRALAISDQSFGANDSSVAICLTSLASVLQDTNRLAEAEPLIRRALAINEQSFGPDSPSFGDSVTNLADLLQAANRLVEAEPLMRRALAMAERSFGLDHPDVAIRLGHLAGLLQATNRLAESEPLKRRALAITEHNFGPDHPNVAAALNNLGVLLYSTGRLTEVEPLLQRALAIVERVFGPDHPKVATTLLTIGQLLEDTNRLAEAEPLMRRTVEIFRKFTRDTGHPHPQLQRASDDYLSLLKAMGMGRGGGEIVGELRTLAGNPTKEQSDPVLSPLRTEGGQKILLLQIDSGEIEITREHLRYNSQVVPLADITGLRAFFHKGDTEFTPLGFVLSIISADCVRYQFSIRVALHGSVEIRSRRFFSDQEKGEAEYEAIRALLQEHVAPSLCMRLAKDIFEGEQLPLGRSCLISDGRGLRSCWMTRDGLVSTLGTLFWRRQKLTPWADVRPISQGSFLWIQSRKNQQALGRFNTGKVWNAAVFSGIVRLLLEMLGK